MLVGSAGFTYAGRVTLQRRIASSFITTETRHEYCAAPMSALRFPHRHLRRVETAISTDDHHGHQASARLEDQQVVSKSFFLFSPFPLLSTAQLVGTNGLIAMFLLSCIRPERDKVYSVLV